MRQEPKLLLFEIIFSVSVYLDFVGITAKWGPSSVMTREEVSLREMELRIAVDENGHCDRVSEANTRPSPLARGSRICEATPCKQADSCNRTCCC